MGQSQSQPPEEEGYDPINNTTKRELDSNNPAGDDLLFSSQVHGSINPAFRAPSRQTKIHSSSPALHLISPEAQTPIAGRKMAELSSYQSNPYLQSSMDVDEQLNHGDLPQVSKKKKRNKKRLSSTSQPDNDRRPFIPHSSIDLDTSAFDSEHQPDQAENDDAGVVINNTPFSASAQSQARSQQKKERKESKRAAKLAKRLAEASLPYEDAGEPSPFADLWNSQESVIAKREPDNDENAGAQGEQVESPEAAQKKRKRKSRNQVDDTSQANSKKHKHTHNGMADREQITNGTFEGAGASFDDTIDLNALAEQLYSSRKKKPHPRTIQEEMTPAEPSSEADSAVNLEVAGGAIENGPANGESGEGETSREDHINTDHHMDNGHHIQNGVNDTELSSDYNVTNYRSSASAASSHDLAHEFNNVPVSTGTTGDATGDNEESVSSHTNGALYGEVQVPSSMPDPNNAGESGVKRRAATTYSTGRKRVAKPDFFSRVAEDADNTNEAQSPTAAALSRRKGKEREIPAAESDSPAGATPTTGRATQPTITRMLRDNTDAENKTPATPSSTSVVRVRTPKTPVTLSGAFSEFEIRNLSQAIERWRDDTNMTQYEVNELIHRNPKEIKATELWEHIIATCPGRSRQKVINQTRRRFHNFVARGTWTPEQQEELKRMYELYGNRYSLIGGLINRHPEDIRDRIRNYLICGDKQRKDHWSSQETEQLVAIVQQAIVEIRRQRSNRGLDDSRPVEEDINWQLVSQGMGRTRSRLQCISKWKSIKPQLEGGGMDGELVSIEEIIEQARETAVTMSYRNRSFVIKAILKSGANADSRIPWLKVRNELNQQWTRPPLMVVWFRLKRSTPNFQSLNVKEICTLLLQNFQQTHKLEYPSEDSPDLDYDAEYSEIEYRIKKARRAHATAKTPATVSLNSDDEEEDEDEGAAGEAKEDGEDEAIRSQLDATSEQQVTVGGEGSEQARPSSIDLGAGKAAHNDEAEIQDSEPEANTRRPHRRVSRRRRHSPSLPLDPRLAEFDEQSSDTNASQVSSIPAH